MEGIDELRQLLDYVAGRYYLDPKLRESLDGLVRSPESLAAKLRAIAKERGLKPEVVDAFDLASIEVDSFLAFTKEADYRFFGEGLLGPER